jgi:signal peptidase II
MPVRGGGNVTLRAAAVVACAIVVVDRATKWVVTSTMLAGDSIQVIPGFFSLTYVRNPGAAFGLLAESPLRVPLLSLFAIAAVGSLVYLLVHSPADRVPERVAASGIIGGAVGNLYDRFTYGWVVDFLDFYVGRWHWPAFNVADSCISVGVAVLLLASLLRSEHDGAAPTAQDGPHVRPNAA